MSLEAVIGEVHFSLKDGGAILGEHDISSCDLEALVFVNSPRAVSGDEVREIVEDREVDDAVEKESGFGSIGLAFVFLENRFAIEPKSDDGRW